MNLNVESDMSKYKVKVKPLVQLMRLPVPIHVNGHGDIAINGYYLGNITAEKFCGKTILVELTPGDPNWQYVHKTDDGEFHYFCKDWVDVIEELPDWSEVPVDAKVIAQGRRAHFARYLPESNEVLVYVNGRTSYTASRLDLDAYAAKDVTINMKGRAL